MRPRSIIRPYLGFAKHAALSAVKGKGIAALAAIWALVHLAVDDVDLYLLRHHGRVECPCCGWSGNRFRVFDSDGYRRYGYGRFVYNRYDALCPNCGSLERYRLLIHLMQYGFKPASTPLRVLDVAPTGYFRRWITQAYDVDYVSIDLSPGKALIQMDVTQLDFPANTFDLIVCSHVLEHVLDDRKAMRELGRVLKQDGRLLILVPMHRRLGSTVEYGRPNAKDHWHCRRYGRDFGDRLKSQGLTVAEYSADSLGTNTSRRYGLLEGEVLFLCAK